MVICENILLENGGEIISYQSDEFLFNKDTYAEHYLQIKKGNVKISISNSRKEFLYGLPCRGHCIGESYLFIRKKYPFNAIAISECEIIRLQKIKFEKLVAKNPDLLANIYAYTAERIHYKNLMLASCIIDTVERMTILLNYIKEFHMLEDTRPFTIPYTRQQLALLSGLRLETIIRTVKKMEDHKLLRIVKGKICY